MITFSLKYSTCQSSILWHSISCSSSASVNISVCHLYFFFEKCLFCKVVIFILKSLSFMYAFCILNINHFVVCKYFLPIPCFCLFISLIFNLCCAEALQFDIVPLVYFCFFPPLLLKTNVRKFSPVFF